MKNKYPVLMILLAAICWGTLGSAIRFLSAYNFSTMDIVFIRCAGTTLFLLSYIIIFRRKSLKIKLKDIWCFIGTGIFSILFFNYCYFYTIQNLNLSISALLLYTSPCFIIIISRVVFKEKIDTNKIMSLMLCIFGCVMISGAIGNINNIKPFFIFTGICSGLGYGLYSIFTRLALQKGYENITITFYTFLIAAIGSSYDTDILYLKKIVNNELKADYIIIYIIIVGTLIPYMLYNLGLKGVETGTAGIIACIEPVVATLLGTFVFKEKIEINVLIGIISIIGSTLVINRKAKTRIKE